MSKIVEEEVEDVVLVLHSLQVQVQNTYDGGVVGIDFW